MSSPSFTRLKTRSSACKKMCLAHAEPWHGACGVPFNKSSVGRQSRCSKLSIQRRNQHVSPNFEGPLITDGRALFVVALAEPGRLVRPRTSACARAGSDANGRRCTACLGTLPTVFAKRMRHRRSSWRPGKRQRRCVPESARQVNLAAALALFGRAHGAGRRRASCHL